MASILAHDVALDYPVFSDAPDRSPSTSEARDELSAGAILAATFGKPAAVRALDKVSFEVRSGQRLGLIGRNGSGKSTLLRVLAGVYEPTEGVVRVEGKVAPIFNVGLGTRPESTGRQNIVLRGLLRGLSAREAQSKVEEIAEFSGLGPFIDLPVRTYSSGMAMRLSFSIATAFRPEVLLLDEWIGAGDAEFQDKARERMKSMVDDAGITVIASHNRPLLRSVCGLGLWLEKGEMRAFGPIDEVYKIVDAWKAKRWEAMQKAKKAEVSAQRRDLVDEPKREA